MADPKQSFQGQPGAFFPPPHTHAYAPAGGPSAPSGYAPGQQYGAPEYAPQQMGGYSSQHAGGYASSFPGVPMGVPLTPAGVPTFAPGGAAPHSFDVITPQVSGGRKDTWAAIAFWVHLFVLFILAMAMGVPAVRASQTTGDDVQRDNLDFSASLFVRMIVLSCCVGGIVSALFFYVLQRCGGAMIRIALYASLAIQLVMAAVMFAYAPVAGAFLLLFAAFTGCYIYFVRNRIEFAAAHLQCACDALQQYRSVFGVAVLMLIVQALLVSIWSLAAFGVAWKLNEGNGTNASANGTSDKKGNAAGGIITFLFLISLYWGAQVFTNVVHFVTASVVGHWWFSPTPSSVVRGSLYRAFTDSFGSIALGSLIVAVLRALYVMAKSSQERASRRGDAAGAFFAGCAACLLRLVADAVEYFNKWAYIYVALTGDDFRAAGKSAWDLFTNRGWTAVINDDLTGQAISIVCVMVGAVSAVIGTAAGYVAMGSHHNGTYAGVIGFFCFVTGIAMANVMGGVLKSAVRTIFVCFAMNPTALQQTHPVELNRLVAAWNKFQPQAFMACGYAGAFGSSSVVGV